MYVVICLLKTTLRPSRLLITFILCSEGVLRKPLLYYQLLAMVNSGRLKLYDKDQAPRAVYEEMWSQIKKDRYRLPAAETIDFYMEAGEGHDDFLISLALLTEAIEGMILPAASSVVKPKRLYEGEGRF